MKQQKKIYNQGHIDVIVLRLLKSTYNVLLINSEINISFDDYCSVVLENVKKLKNEKGE